MTQRNQLLFVISIIVISIGIWFIAYWKKPILPQKIDTLIVGTNAEYQPFSFIKNDTITGFDIDVITHVAKRLEKKIVIKDMPFDALIPEIQLGTIHVIAAGLVSTPEREKRIFFTKPHLGGDPLVIISPINKSLKTTDELTGKQVVVNEGFTADYYVSALDGPIVTKLLTVNEAILSLEAGQSDAFVSARSAVLPFLQQYSNGKYHVAIIPDTEELYVLGISKKYPELFAQIQKALEKMEEDGTLATIKKKWNLP